MQLSGLTNSPCAQLQVRHSETYTCGGSYIKLLTHADDFTPEGLHDKTAYSILFGPDTCERPRVGGSFSSCDLQSMGMGRPRCQCPASNGCGIFAGMRQILGSAAQNMYLHKKTRTRTVTPSTPANKPAHPCAQVRLIFRHLQGRHKVVEERHMVAEPLPLLDSNTHVYTLILKPNTT